MDYTNILGLLGVFLACYACYIAIVRLYLSPVAKFPGPRLAALTFWYEFYYDVVKGGKYTWKIAQLHDQYGPIVRINPFEIHINDPEFYDELYVNASKRKTEIWSWTVPMFGAPEALLATINHDVHRRRRNAYSNYFSKQSISGYSHVIQEAVDALCTRLQEHEEKGDPINLVHAYSAMAGDVVSGYCFPESYHLLDNPTFAPDFSELWKSISSNSHVLKQFPWLFPTMLKFPGWFVERFLPDFAVTFQWRRVWQQQVMDIKSGSDLTNDKTARSSIFRTVLESDVPSQDKSVSRLVEDAQLMLAAGTETTARTLAVATYHILSNQHVLRSLMSELATSMPQIGTKPRIAELEQLPYLTAVIHESLRVSGGVTHRLQRVFPTEAIRYNEWSIPAGTPASMTSLLIHNNADIFPEPYVFKPERWLPLESEGKRLQKYSVPFTKGSRQCLGINLAWAELYMALAAVVGEFGTRMRLVDTVRGRDVDVSRDLVAGFPRWESKGIMVKISG